MIPSMRLMQLQKIRNQRTEQGFRLLVVPILRHKTILGVGVLKQLLQLQLLNCSFSKACIQCHSSILLYTI